jgi:hypothetical protein
MYDQWVSWNKDISVIETYLLEFLFTKLPAKAVMKTIRMYPTGVPIYKQFLKNQLDQ